MKGYSCNIEGCYNTFFFFIPEYDLEADEIINVFFHGNITKF